jgi:uncharacterized protein (TIGR03437 family)
MATVVLVSLSTGTGVAALLSVPSLSGSPGQTVIVPVTFSAQGQQVSGLQFDLAWDAGVDIKVAIGDGLRKSPKVLYAAVLGSRSVRCLVAGTNLDTLSDGDVVKLFVIVDPSAAGGTVEIRFSNTIASDPRGGAVALSSSGVSMQIQGSISSSLPSEAVLNSASLTAGPVTPGEIITLFETLPADVALFVNGMPAPVIFSGANQMNAIVPFGLDTSTVASIELRASGQVVAKGDVPTATVSPAIFTQDGSGTGSGAILNEDYSLNSPFNPAAAGSTVMIFGTGFGLVSPAAVDGKAAVGPASTVLPVSATIDGTATPVVYAGAAPGLIAGLTQVNVRIPQQARTGAASLYLMIGNTSSQDGVTVFVK